MAVLSRNFFKLLKITSLLFICTCCRFDRANYGMDFFQGLALVFKGEQPVYINKAGKEIWKEEESEIGMSKEKTEKKQSLKRGKTLGRTEYEEHPYKKTR